MTKEDMELRYESYRLPLALYTDPNRLVDFGVNRSYSRWQAEDLEMMGQFYQARNYFSLHALFAFLCAYYFNQENG